MSDYANPISLGFKEMKLMPNKHYSRISNLYVLTKLNIGAFGAKDLMRLDSEQLFWMLPLLLQYAASTSIPDRRENIKLWHALAQQSNKFTETSQLQFWLNRCEDIFGNDKVLDPNDIIWYVNDSLAQTENFWEYFSSQEWNIGQVFHGLF